MSLESASVCVVDGTADRPRPVASEPRTDRLVRRQASLARIALEAGPLSQWLSRRWQPGSRWSCWRRGTSAIAQGDAGEDRPQRCAPHRPADAARLVPPVHCKSLSAQEVRALLTARKLLQASARRRDEPARHLRGFGLKVGRRRRTFDARIGAGRQPADAVYVRDAACNARRCARARRLEKRCELARDMRGGGR